MDETHERLVHFLISLQTFNDRLTQSRRELDRLREVVASHWQDSNRHWHDEKWKALDEFIAHYLSVEGPNYVDFLKANADALKGYLDG